MKSIFEFKNYQSYLLYFFQLKRGNQARLAEFIDCRSSFLTQVIDERVEISLDQAVKIPNFLGLNKNEKMGFFLYVQKEKISDTAEKRFLEDQILLLKHKNNTIKERMSDVGELEEAAKAKYYSSWLYGAIHILCAFSWIQNVDSIADYLKIDRSIANEAVAFLIECGLVQLKNNKLSIGKKQIHLNDDSPHIFNHHLNWRLKAVEKLNTKTSQILNFSSLVGISKKDAEVIKEIFLKSISQTNLVVQQSGEEFAYLINIDFIEI
jgi:uncharacterized protein (TIGR02147 family)